MNHFTQRSCALCLIPWNPTVNKKLRTYPIEALFKVDPRLAASPDRDWMCPELWHLLAESVEWPSSVQEKIAYYAWEKYVSASLDWNPSTHVCGNMMDSSSGPKDLLARWRTLQVDSGNAEVGRQYTIKALSAYWNDYSRRKHTLLMPPMWKSKSMSLVCVNQLCLHKSLQVCLQQNYNIPDATELHRCGWYMLEYPGKVSDVYDACLFFGLPRNTTLCKHQVQSERNGVSAKIRRDAVYVVWFMWSAP